MLHDLHTNSDLLLGNPDASKDPSFASWQSEFSADHHTDEIASLLDRYPELRSEMDSLVPESVSYKDFWMRYLYRKSKIDADEVKRKQLFESNEDENEFDWDGDDEAEEMEHNDDREAFPHEEKASTESVKSKQPKPAQQSEPAPRNSSTSESSTSFDIISQSSAIPPLTMDKVGFKSSHINLPRSLKVLKKVMMIGSRWELFLGVQIFVPGCKYSKCP